MAGSENIGHQKNRQEIVNGIIQTKIKSCTENTSSELVYMGYIWNYKNIRRKNPAKQVDAYYTFFWGRSLLHYAVQEIIWLLTAN